MKLLPVAMCMMNLASFSSGLLEGRLKINALRFMMLYALTILPALRGDLMPFFEILSIPPS